jgi:RNA polymerase sigma factor for flagellar operon FliA
MQRPDTGGSREALFLSQLDLIERVIAFVCARQHLAPADADDFGSYVKLKFVEDDYGMLAKFEGRSSLRTFLTVVIQRLFLDFRIMAWGKWRPSAEAKRAGAVAILLEQLTVRDGHGFDEACEILKTNHRIDMDRGSLERLAARLPSRSRRRFEPDDELANVASKDRPVDDLAAERDHQATADRLSHALRALTAAIDAQDRLILALRFEDGKTVAEIASILRLDQKALYRRMERLLKDLRKGLEAQGIDSTSVLEMLESPAVSIEWRSHTSTENTAVGPSMRKGAQQWR